MVRVGITAGDPNGIGPEIILKALSNTDIYEVCNPIVFITPGVITFYKKTFEKILPPMKFTYHHSSGQKEVLKIKDEIVFSIVPAGIKDFKPYPGNNNPFGARYALDTIKRAFDELMKNNIDVIVTCPWSKSKIPKKEFDFQGITDYLAHYSGCDDYLMMMVHENCRVAFITEHIPLDNVPSFITRETLINKIKILMETLKTDFQISRPTIAITGVNPHCGDEGKWGDSDNIIKIVVEELQKEGVEVFGPFSADGYWGTKMWRNFSATLVPYHDQGMIPFKIITGMSGVNYTAGLPIVRTAPCHGPAFDIAGKGIADPSSLINAIFTAIQIYKNRKEVIEWRKNPLIPQKEEIKE